MTAWAAAPVRERLTVLRRLRHAIATEATALARAAARPGASEADILVAEVLPLLAAIRFLEQRAARLLAPRRERRGRPLWLFGTRLVIRRLPLGRVLVIAPGNYPLMLPAIQAVQALAAGNTVLLKPAPGFAAPIRLLAGMAARAGVPAAAFAVLDDTAEAAAAAIATGVDLVMLTGSSATGRAVLAAAAARLTPCIMELSGEDPFIVLDGADMAYAAKALAFGQAFNGGNTCIAPRRIVVTRAAQTEFTAAAPGQALLVAEDDDAAVVLANEGPYALGACVFGPPARAASVAARLRAGCVVVGDVIAPTADPRLPFGGAAASGFGTTRGTEGLLALTRPQAVVTRRRPEWRHLAPLPASAGAMVAGLLRLAYGSAETRYRAATCLLAGKHRH